MCSRRDRCHGRARRTGICCSSRLLHGFLSCRQPAQDRIVFSEANLASYALRDSHSSQQIAKSFRRQSSSAVADPPSSRPFSRGLLHISGDPWPYPIVFPTGRRGRARPSAPSPGALRRRRRNGVMEYVGSSQDGLLMPTAESTDGRPDGPRPRCPQSRALCARGSKTLFMSSLTSAVRLT